MNLAELMKKYPGQKYRRKGWNIDTYIRQVEGFWKDENEWPQDVSYSFYQEDWELYQEPINITEEHLYRKVKLRNGEVGIIYGFNGLSNYPIYVGMPTGRELTYTIKGVYDICSTEPHELDIVEILPK